MLSLSYTRDLVEISLSVFFFLEDVDECAENNTLCGSLHCVNLPGSFQCLGKCDVGFKRTMDDKECVGKMYSLRIKYLSLIWHSALDTK